MTSQSALGSKGRETFVTREHGLCSQHKMKVNIREYSIQQQNHCFDFFYKYKCELKIQIHGSSNMMDMCTEKHLFLNSDVSTGWKPIANVDPSYIK